MWAFLFCEILMFSSLNVVEPKNIVKHEMQKYQMPSLLHGTIHSVLELTPRKFPFYLLMTFLLYFLIIFCLPRCILPDFASISSLASLPFLSWCHRPLTNNIHICRNFDDAADLELRLEQQRWRVSFIACIPIVCVVVNWHILTWHFDEDW